MRKTYYPLLALVLLFCIRAAAQPSNGLVAHWAMNGNAHDTSGNGHNGTIHNVTPVAGVSGVAGTAMYFNGSGSYIDVPSTTSLNFVRNTICAIIKPTGYYAGSCQGNFILQRGTQGSAGSYGLEYFDNAYNDCSTSDTNLYVFATSTGTAGASSASWQSNNKVHTGRWYYVVAVYDSSSYKIYVNDTLAVNIPNMKTAPASITDHLSIGNYLPGGSTDPYNFIGVMEDLCLYNRALNDTEIAQYSAHINITDTNIILCEGSVFSLHYWSHAYHAAGSVFTAQLSDANGSFANPLSLGTTTTNGPGTIACTIPTALLPGSGYLVRVISSNNTDTSRPVSATVLLPHKTTVTIAATGTPPYPYYTVVTFSSNVTNGGANPNYQWKRNGANIAGATAGSYTAVAGSNFGNNDRISLAVTSSNPCDTAGNSDTITTQVIVVSSLDTGMVAHWAMNGNAHDTTGNGHDGTAYHIKPATGILGQPNTAYEFDSANSSISVPTATSLNFVRNSLCAVFQPSGFYSGQCQGNFILYRGTQGAPGSYGLQYFDNAYNDCNTSDTNLYVFAISTGTAASTPSASIWQSNYKVHTGNWYCVVATYDSATFNIYVDGLLATSIPNAYTAAQAINDSLGIGMYYAGGNAAPYNFNGLIDDMRLYNRALNVNEINEYCGQVHLAVNKIEQERADMLTVVPNPNNGNFVLQGRFNAGRYSLIITDITGRILLKENGKTINGELHHNIELDNRLSSGIYIVQVAAEGKTQTIKFTKQ